jgi:hypothetical protein
MRLLLSALAVPALLLAAGPVSAQQPQVRSRAIVNAETPPSTGDATCDQAAAAWRSCIAASPKPAPDKVQANTEVDKFVRDVFDARGPHREMLIGACGRTASGYRSMIETGTCAANVTGARDDQATRVGSPTGAIAVQRRSPR